jgi:hypothetical protein
MPLRLSALTRSDGHRLHGSGGALLYAAVVTVLAGMLGVAMFGLAGDSLALPMLLVVALAGLAAFLWYPGPKRRMWLVTLAFIAPFDLSKAIIPPLDRFYSPGLYFSLGHAAVLALTATWLFEHLLVNRLRLPLTKLDKIGLIFLAWVWLSALAAPGDKVLLAGSAITYSLCVLAYYVVSHATQSTRDVMGMLKAFVAGLIVQAMHVSAQMLTHSFLPLPGAKVQGAATGNVLNFGGQGEAFRPIGAFDHPNALADYLTLIWAPSMALVLMGPSRIHRRVWWVALGVLTVTSVLLLLTLSRGAWAASAVGLAVIAVTFWRHRVIGSTHLLGAIMAGVLGFSAMLAAYPQVLLRLTAPDDRSTESRVVLTDQALAMIQLHPLTGVGFGAYNRAAPDVTPPSWALISTDYQEQLLKLVVHNNYLLVASQMGLPALLCWLYLLVRMVRQAWPLQRWQDPGAWALGVGLAGAMASQMLFLASDNYDADIRVFLLWLTAGLLQAMTRLSSLPPSGSVPPQPDEGAA